MQNDSVFERPVATELSEDFKLFETDEWGAKVGAEVGEAICRAQLGWWQKRRPTVALEIGPRRKTSLLAGPGAAVRH
jgi:hypothetical protein